MKIIRKITTEVTLACSRGHDIVVGTYKFTRNLGTIWGCPECSKEDFMNGARPRREPIYKIKRYELTKKDFPRFFSLDSPPMFADGSHRLGFPVVLIDDDGSEVPTDEAIAWATIHFKKQGRPRVVATDYSDTPTVEIMGPTAEELARACFIVEEGQEQKTNGKGHIKGAKAKET